MRPFVILCGALATSLVVSALLLRSNLSLREELAQAQTELALVSLARKADAVAISLSETGRTAAAHTAQEQRDALHEVEKDAAALSDSEFLCRVRGVCFPHTDDGAAPARKPAAGLPGTDGTAK